MTLPPPGWHPDHDDPGLLRYWDGRGWTEHRRPKGAPPASAAVREKLTAAAGRFAPTDVTVPPGTIWSTVGKPLSGIGAGRYRMDSQYLYFETGTLRTDSQQVPLARVVDVDVKQTLTQKARDVFTLLVHVERPHGIEVVRMEDIPDGRKAQHAVNEASMSARHAAQSRQNTMRYEGTPPSVPSLAAPTVAPDSTVDPIAQLEKLAGLRDAGIVSEAEFVAKKTEILGRM